MSGWSWLVNDAGVGDPGIRVVQPPNSALDRLLRLVPAEVVAFYLGAVTIIAAFLPSASAADTGWVLLGLLLAFLLALPAVPMSFYQRTRAEGLPDRQRRRRFLEQSIVGVFGFLVYAYATPGIFTVPGKLEDVPLLGDIPFLVEIVNGLPAHSEVLAAIGVILFGATVALYRPSLIADGVPVPSIVDKPEQEAKDLLKSAGLTVGTATPATHATIAKGNVVSSEPVADTRVAAGTAIDYVLSTGP